MFDGFDVAGMAQGLGIAMLMFVSWIVWRNFSRSPRLVRRIMILAGWTFATVVVSFALTGLSFPTMTAAVLSFGILVIEIVSTSIGATPSEPNQAPTATALRRDPPG
jgi:hypothetical protein